MKSRDCKKHDHKITKLLKISIFATIMLAPFLAVASKVAYVTFNKNANESYAGSYSYSTQLSLANIIVSQKTEKETLTSTDGQKTYYKQTNPYLSNEFKSSGLDQDWPSSNAGYSYLFFSNYLKIDNTEYNNITYFTYTKNAGITRFNVYDTPITNIDYVSYTSNGYINVYDSNNTLIDPTITKNVNTNNETHTSSFTSNKEYCYTLVQNPSVNYINSYIANVYVVDYTLSSVFYSAVDELDKASIFSWTTDTLMYTSITNMTEGLGIVSPPLAVLLTYWSIITAVYIVIDIVIETFVYLTHWFTDKMV